MAFTATKDLMLPATVTGSWPRPRWYTENMWGRPLDTAMMDPWYREQFTDAHAIVVSDQAARRPRHPDDRRLPPRRGRRRAARGTTTRCSAGRGSSTRSSRRARRARRCSRIPVGTMLDSIYKTWRWPRVVGKVEHDPKNPLEYAKIWRIAQQSAGRPASRSSSAPARRRCWRSSSTATRRTTTSTTRSS